MKRFSLLALITTVTFLFMISIAVAQPIKPPPGAHYNLNVIGFANCRMATGGIYPECYKGAGYDSSGHTIFVPLKTANTDLNICQPGSTAPDPVTVAWLEKGVRILVADDGISTDVHVVDRDATDGTASLNIPDGCYEIWARALGKPGGCMDIDTIICTDELGVQVDCKANLGDNSKYVAVGHLNVDRIKGEKPHWDNATGELLHNAGVGTGDPGYFDFFWQIFNDNLRLLQLRIIYTGPAGTCGS